MHAVQYVKNDVACLLKEQRLFPSGHPLRYDRFMSDAPRPSGPIAEQLIATGDTLFKWRSYAPLVLLDRKSVV